MVWRAADWREQAGKLSDSEPYQQTYRTCGYCGSIHPEDLLAVLAQGATLHGSDWKYGWPHKFYVEGIPNPIAGQMIPVYTFYGAQHPNIPATAVPDGHGFKAQTGAHPAPPTQTAKWYNLHFLDAGFDDAAFLALAEAVHRASGILFQVMPDGQLRYSAPYRGFQR